MKTRLVTSAIIIATIVGIIAYDIWVVIEPTPGDTISEVILGFSMRHPFASFASGVLCGHLFWPMAKRTKAYVIGALATLIAVGISMLVLDISGMVPTLNPCLWFVLGVPAGHFGWSQEVEEG